MLGLVLPGIIIFLWWLGINSGTAVVPSFGSVLTVLVHPFTPPDVIYSRSLAFSLLMTMLRLFIGFGLGVATAIPLGFWAGENKVVNRIFYPLVQLARPVNPVVLLPMATVFFGFASVASIFVGEFDAWKYDVWDQVQFAMIFILWWGAFFPIFMSTQHGVRSVRNSHIETLKLLGASERDVFRYVIIPHSLPSIMNGVRVAMGIAWLVLIAAEIYPGTRSGIGYMLCTACKTSDYQYTFAALIIIGATGLIIDIALGRIEKSVSKWQSLER